MLCDRRLIAHKSTLLAATVQQPALNMIYITFAHMPSDPVGKRSRQPSSRSFVPGPPGGTSVVIHSRERTSPRRFLVTNLRQPTRPRRVVVIVVADDCPAPDSRLARQEPQQLWPPRRSAERQEQVRRGGGNRRRDKGRSRAQQMRDAAIGASSLNRKRTTWPRTLRNEVAVGARQRSRSLRGARQRARGGGPGGGPVARASRGCVTAR